MILARSVISLLVLLGPACAIAQLAPKPQKEVVAYPPDGGMEVVVSGEVTVRAPLGVIVEGQTAPVDVSVTNTYVPIGMGPLGTPKLSAEVTGLAGGPVSTTVDNVPAVTVSGPVTFTSQTLALLAGERNCEYRPVGHHVIDGGVGEFPSFAGQTGISLTAHNFGVNVDYVSCWPYVVDAGPNPNCTLGSAGVTMILHNQGVLELDIKDDQRVRCLACTHAGPPSGGTALVGGSVSICTPP